MLTELASLATLSLFDLHALVFWDFYLWRLMYLLFIEEQPWALQERMVKLSQLLPDTWPTFWEICTAHILIKGIWHWQPQKVDILCEYWSSYEILPQLDYPEMGLLKKHRIVLKWAPPPSSQMYFMEEINSTYLTLINPDAFFLV